MVMVGFPEFANETGGASSRRMRDERATRVVGENRLGELPGAKRTTPGLCWQHYVPALAGAKVSLRTVMSSA